MSEAAGAEAPAGLLATLAGVFATPGATFASIARRPSFWAPLLAFVAVSAAFTAVWLDNLDPTEFARAQVEDSPLAARMSAEDQAAGVTQQARIFPYVAWLAPLVLSPLDVVVAAAAFLVVFRFFYGSQVTLRQSLSIVAWTFLTVYLIREPLALLVLYLRQDWNVDPSTALQANLTLLLDKRSASRPVYALAESFDLFSAWTLALLSIGYGAAAGLSARRASIGVVALWAVYVVGQAAVTAVF